VYPFRLKHRKYLRGARRSPAITSSPVRAAAARPPARNCDHLIALFSPPCSILRSCNTRSRPARDPALQTRRPAQTKRHCPKRGAKLPKRSCWIRKCTKTKELQSETCADRGASLMTKYPKGGPRSKSTVGVGVSARPTRPLARPQSPQHFPLSCRQPAALNLACPQLPIRGGGTPPRIYILYLYGYPKRGQNESK